MPNKNLLTCNILNTVRLLTDAKVKYQAYISKKLYQIKHGANGRVALVNLVQYSFKLL